jgi:hypothetical protein
MSDVTASVGAVLRWLCALVVAGTLSAFTFLLVTGDYITDGPVLVAVTESHGLHEGDLFVMAGWAVAMAALFLLARRPRRLRTS